MDLPTIQPASLAEVRGGLVRAAGGSTANLMMMQQMQAISDSIRNATLQQNQMSPMMVAMLGMALMNRA